MTELSEAYQSRRGQTGLQTDREVIYYTFDQTDVEVARAYVATNAAVLYDCGGGLLLPRRTIRQEPTKSASVFKWILDYGIDQNQTPQSDPDVSSFNTTLTFNLIGGTQHITTSLAYKNYRAAGAGGVSHTDHDCIDVKGAIGWDTKTGQVRGVEAYVPVMDYTLTTQFPNRIVTDAYIDDLYALTGKVCDATFKRRQAGEVIFKGARGSKRGLEMWEIGFEFCWSPNIVGGSLGGITYDKLGWEYLDVLFGDGTGLIGKQKVQVPIQINVHQIYEFGDFAKLKIGV